MMLSDNGLGDAGARVVIEGFSLAKGRALSSLGQRPRGVAAGLQSGTTKRLLDGDQGPNTGGMGRTRRLR